MTGTPPRIAGSVRLALGSAPSAVTKHRRSLWLGLERTCAVERLVEQPDGSFADAARFSLAEFFVLPRGAEGDADIQGLAVDDRFLWVAGSHAVTRPQGKGLSERLDRGANRYFLGRLPLEETADGVYTPVGDGGWDAGGGPAVPEKLKMSLGRNRLVRMLRGDPHLSPFLDIPGAENGFHVGGLAVRGEKVMLGLRGPVVDGRAVVLGLECRATGKGTLRPNRLTSDGRRYRKHFLSLDGLSVHDLMREGDDLLLLAGPPMSAAGPLRLYRWKEAMKAAEDGAVEPGAIEAVMDLPQDGAEVSAACVAHGSAGIRLLAVRVEPEGRLRADLFDLPDGPGGKATG